MVALIDLTGQRFGRLAVTGRAADRVYPGGTRTTRWHCLCECGAEVTVDRGDLRSKRRDATRSCGCLQAELNRARLGSANPAWRHEDIGYDAAHDRVKATRGKASEHLCVDCGRVAQDWSYVGGCPNELKSKKKQSPGCLYSPDPNRYVPRCKKCHKRFDRKEREVA